MYLCTLKEKFFSHKCSGQTPDPQFLMCATSIFN